jgi:hypothetical protein
MGVYLLQEEIHHKVDSPRTNFFWHGLNMKKKYHMSSWELLATHKKVGCLGFTNAGVMNKCLCNTYKFHHIKIMIATWFSFYFLRFNKLSDKFGPLIYKKHLNNLGPISVCAFVDG